MEGRGKARASHRDKDKDLALDQVRSWRNPWKSDSWKTAEGSSESASMSLAPGTDAARKGGKKGDLEDDEEESVGEEKRSGEGEGRGRRRRGRRRKVETRRGRVFRALWSLRARYNNRLIVLVWVFTKPTRVCSAR
ncbi:hypothetical protein GW17_00034335 [Ensete ventricosum]|nr:hypothetical protein GW17_00034335 [Ensete ventricosum]